MYMEIISYRNLLLSAYFKYLKQFLKQFAVLFSATQGHPDCKTDI